DPLLDCPVAWLLELGPSGQGADGNTPPPDTLSVAEPLPLNLPEPAQAGRFRLVGEIARGGMGAVLRAHDPEMDRALAVKVILPQHRNDPSLVRRFLGEARLAGQPPHPPAVPVPNLPRPGDGQPLFALELLSG